ncbi:MAG: hypothetical protein M3R11_08025 [Acidobacteriota bacterium]|nr:hypothetical protein [Acidobacteriota bacterium]
MSIYVETAHAFGKTARMRLSIWDLGFRISGLLATNPQSEILNLKSRSALLEFNLSTALIETFID